MSRAIPTFGDVLRQLRTAASLSQEDLAERAGVSLRGISDLERGVRRAPHLTTVRLLADALELGAADRQALLAAARPGRVSETVDVASGHSAPLPRLLTALLGREHELAALVSLLQASDIRLVTITGAGGTGKTRLALEGAAHLRSTFHDGVVFVDLTPLADPNLVIPAIASALAVRERLEQSHLDALSSVLASKQMLLILDNFERVLAAAPHVVTLLAACSQVTILTTSREALRVRGERVFPLLPLQLPLADQLPPFDELAGVPAIALFVERAVANSPHFALTPDNAAVVASICRRLDGLPLAIELAAARISALPPSALLAHLEPRLPVLTGGSRDLPPRQRTMRDAIAWSYDLLEPEEQRLFRCLAVFAGGATFESIEAVAHPSRDVDLLQGLATLIDKSLLRQDAGPGGEPRFSMLETIREYGLELLAESGEGDVTRDAHAAHYLAVAEAVGPEAWGPAATAELGRLATELGNLRAALGWLVGREDADRALRLAVALQPFWYLRGRFGEGRGWLERALAFGGAPEVRGRALFAAGVLATEQVDLDRADALLAAAVPLLRGSGDPRWLVNALNHRASVALSRGELERAEALCAEALTHAREEGNDELPAHPTMNLGRLAAARGDHLRAEALVADAVAMLRSAGARWHAAVGCMMLGGVAHARGEHDRAAALYSEALPVFAALPDPATLARCVEGLAAVAASGGRLGECARLLGAAAGQRDVVGHPVHPEDRAAYERTLAAARVGLGLAGFSAAWAAGRALSADEAVTEALAVGAELARADGPRSGLPNSLQNGPNTPSTR